MSIDLNLVALGLQFLAMLAGHYCADRILQPGYISAHKRHDEFVTRWQALGIHGAVHGFMWPS